MQIYKKVIYRKIVKRNINKLQKLQRTNIIESLRKKCVCILVPCMRVLHPLNEVQRIYFKWNGTYESDLVIWHFKWDITHNFFISYQKKLKIPNHLSVCL